VALYTIRDVAPGEELTFDYSSVTESEDEFKQAFCMCSTRHCRGSYLYYTGSKAYMQASQASCCTVNLWLLCMCWYVSDALVCNSCW
jgi:hypothetical protein